jgi:hypothetical protein
MMKKNPLIKKLEQLQTKAKAEHGKSYTDEDIFTDDFIRSHAKFHTFIEMRTAFGAEIDAPNLDQWNAFVRYCQVGEIRAD